MGNDHDTPQTPDDAVPEARPRRAPPTIELAASDVVTEPAAGEPPPDPAEAHAPRRPGLIAAALTGGGAALAVLAAAWLAGWPLTPEPATPAAPTADAVAALATRLSTLEADFHTAAALPQATESAGLAPRLSALEQAETALRDQLAAARAATDKLAATVGAMQSELAALKAAPGDGAPAPDLGPLEARIAAATATAEAARDTAAKAVTTAATAAAAKADTPANADTATAPLRRAIVAAQLASAVQQGEPYAALLAAARNLAGGSATDIAPPAALDAFAATGVPRASALSAELASLLPAPPHEAPTSADAGLLERLQASATRLVRIRRDGPADDSSREAIAARAAAAAGRGDLAAARQTLMTLPAAERGAFAAWIAKVEARDTALAAARSYAAAAAAALAQPTP